MHNLQPNSISLLAKERIIIKGLREANRTAHFQPAVGEAAKTFCVSDRSRTGLGGEGLN